MCGSCSLRYASARRYAGAHTQRLHHGIVTQQCQCPRYATACERASGEAGVRCCLRCTCAQPRGIHLWCPYSTVQMTRYTYIVCYVDYPFWSEDEAEHVYFPTLDAAMAYLDSNRELLAFHSPWLQVWSFDESAECPF